MSEANPWKTKSSQVVYENPWMRVREDQVIRPDGKDGIYGVVETRIATGAVALDEEDNIYLVGQYRYTMDCYSWEIPEGGSDEGESAFEACSRELKEETGIIASKWWQLGAEIHMSNCISSERGVLFLAKDLDFLEAEPEGTEDLKVQKLPVSDAFRMMHSGEIQDSLTIIALHRLQHLDSNPESKSSLLTEISH